MKCYITLIILFIIQILTVSVFPKTISLKLFDYLLLKNTFNYRIGKVLTREIQYEMLYHFYYFIYYSNTYCFGVSKDYLIETL